MCEKELWPAVLAFAQIGVKKPVRLPGAVLHRPGLERNGTICNGGTAYRGALALETTDARVWNNLGGCSTKNCSAQARASAAWSRFENGSTQQARMVKPGTMAGRMGHHHKVWSMPTGSRAGSEAVEAYLHKAAAAKALKKPDVSGRFVTSWPPSNRKNSAAGAEPGSLFRCRQSDNFRL